MIRLRVLVWKIIRALFDLSNYTYNSHAISLSTKSSIDRTKTDLSNIYTKNLTVVRSSYSLKVLIYHLLSLNNQ